MQFDIHTGDIVELQCGFQQNVDTNDPQGLIERVVCVKHQKWETIIDHDPLREARITNRMVPREVVNELRRVVDEEDLLDVVRVLTTAMVQKEFGVEITP